MKTKKRGLLARFLGALLISGLALPGPVHALRPELSPKTKAGIEDALAAGTEEMDPMYVREAVQGLYQFPALVEKHFGKDGAQPASWAAFLEAAGRESSWTWDGGLGSFWKLPKKTRQGLAYRLLRKLPVPLRLSVGGELVLHNQREGVLLLGENGAEPSLLAIFMTGDPFRGWSRHSPWEWIFSAQKYEHTWTYLGGNGDLLVLEFPQGLYAGRVPRKNGQYQPLRTRFPLEWATEVPVHEGSFEGRAFQTEIEGKDQFVPLRRVVRFSRNELMDLRTASLPSNGNLSGSLQKLPAQDLFVDISQLRWRNNWDKDPKRKIALQNLQAAVRTVEDFFVPQFSAGSEESSPKAKAVLEDARRFLSEGNYRVDRLAEAIRDLRLLEQPPEGELSPEEWVRAFIRQMRADDGLPLDRVLLDELTDHSRVPYSAGPFTRGEVQGKPEDKELLEGTLGEAKRVLVHAGAQMGLTPKESLDKLKWESLERFERYLYEARDSEGDLLLRDVPAETMIRWFYRQIPQRLVPAVADRAIPRTDLARALSNPFRLANGQGNKVTADLIRRLLADGAVISGQRLTDDPAELAKEPSLVIPWVRLQMAANLVDYSNPKILEAIAAEEGGSDAEKLTGYLRKRLETPFAWGAYNERDLEDYVRSVLRARRPEPEYVEEVVFGDNNAQLVATLKLIEAKLSANPRLRVRLVLKGDNGVMNDASVEDGEALLRAEPEFYRLLLQYRREDRFEILTGPRSHGTPLDLVSEEIARVLFSADAVFAEGEANAVTLNGLRGNLYLSLRLKTPLFIRHVVGVDPEEMKDYPPAFLAVRGGRYYDRVLASSGPEGGRVTIEDRWARPNHVRFRIRPGAQVFGQLPSGEEMEIYIRKGKSSGQSRVVATAPIGWVHYRGRSLREGAVGQYTLQKTGKILDIKEREIRENHQELYERPVDLASQGIFFLPLPSVRDLLGRRASMREWRMAAPYVFRFIHRLPDGSAEVELRYREPVEVVSDPAARLEEPSSRRRIQFADDLDIFVTEGQFVPDDSARLFLDLFQQHPGWLEGDLLVVETGAGAMSIFLARHGRRVVGLDVQPQAVADTEFNKANQPDDVRQRLTFGVSDVYQNLAQVTGDPQRRFDAAFFVHPIFIGENFSTSREEAFETAAYAGPEGEVVRRAVEGLPRVLKPGKSGFFFAASENETNLNVLGSDGLRAMLPDENWRMDPTGVTLTVPERFKQGGEYLEGHILYEVFRITPPGTAYLEKPKNSFYVGTFQRNLDSARRVSIPPTFPLLRRASHIVGSKEGDEGTHYLQIGPTSESSDRSLRVDSEGRILLPREWLDWIGVKQSGAVYWLGVKDHAELWDVGTWDRVREELTRQAGLEEAARVEGESIVVPVADQLVVGTLAHSPGIRELQASLGDSGIQVKEVKSARESAELLRAELVELLILSPEDAEAGDWRGGTAVPTIVLPAFVAASLTEPELAALAAEAKARGGILYINEITREGAENQVLVLRMA